MAFKGERPEDPVCVVSVLLFNHTREKLALGVRQKTRYEKRHLDTLSTFTREIPSGIFSLLAGGNPLAWQQGYRRLETAEDFKIGYGRHGEADDIFVIESVLGKVGLGKALISGAVRGMARAAVVSLTHVADKDTGESEWTAMLSYDLTLKDETDYRRVPHKSVAYDPIVWESAALLPEAFRQNNVAILGDPTLDKKFLCITGACVASAVFALDG